MDGPEDRLFAKFRLTGSPRALGQLYDRVAPELLEVARHLAGDPLEAEDLVQRTFVTAIERAATFEERTRVVPWLVGILGNHARDERRRRGRRPDPMRLELRKELLPAGEAEAEARELDEHLDRALATLSEEQRAVLTLRLRHDLSAAEIADALGRPAGTVRSQLARGLERLRAALPASLVATAGVAYGLPQGLSVVRAAVLAEAQSAALPPLVAAKGYLLWSLAPIAEMVLMKKLALVATLVVGTFLGYRLLEGEPAAAPAPALAPVVDTGELPAAPGPARAPDPEEVAREALATPESAATESAVAAQSAPEATTGTLELIVLDPAGAPVVGEVCVLTRLEQGVEADVLVLRTGLEGRARLEELEPGHLQVRPLRGDSRGVAISAGRTSSLRFDLEEGIEVRGVVVDGEDQPVPQAEVWLSERWNSRRGFALTRADGRGEFSLRSVSRDHYVGAFAPGHGISYLQAPRAGRGEIANLRIVLDGAGGDVEIEVTDTNGRAVDGARVLVGDQSRVEYRRLADGSSGPPAPPRHARTDAAGRARIESVAVGAAPLLVRKPGFGLARGTIEVTAGGGRARVALQPEARLIGTVRHEDGSPAPQVALWTGERMRFESSRAYTDPQGRYLLRELPAGEVELHGELRGLGSVRASVSLVAGETKELDLRLVVEPRIHGELVDAEGRGLAGYTISARREDTRRYTETAVADAGGRFSMTVEADRRYSLLVRRPGDWRGFPLLVEPGVEASITPLRLQVPEQETQTARLRLRAQGPDGRPAPGTMLDLWHRELEVWRSFLAEGDEAEIVVEGLAPGSCELTLRHADHPRLALEAVELAAGEERDLGAQRFAPSGRVTGVLVGNDDESILASLEFHIGQAGGSFAVIERTGTRFRSGPVAEGTHMLSVMGDFVLPMHRQVEVRAGETTEVRLRLEPAGLGRVVIRVPEGERAPRWIGASARDAGGRVVWSRACKRLDDGSFEARVAALPGSYSFDAKDDRGRTASGAFEVLDFSGKAPPVELRLGE